jgi:hypothetical protein
VATLDRPAHVEGLLVACAVVAPLLALGIGGTFLQVSWLNQFRKRALFVFLFVIIPGVIDSSYFWHRNFEFDTTSSFEWCLLILFAIGVVVMLFLSFLTRIAASGRHSVHAVAMISVSCCLCVMLPIGLGLPLLLAYESEWSWNAASGVALLYIVLAPAALTALGMLLYTAHAAVTVHPMTMEQLQQKLVSLPSQVASFFAAARKSRARSVMVGTYALTVMLTLSCMHLAFFLEADSGGQGELRVLFGVLSASCPVILVLMLILMGSRRIGIPEKQFALTWLGLLLPVAMLLPIYKLNQKEQKLPPTSSDYRLDHLVYPDAAPYMLHLCAVPVVTIILLSLTFAQPTSILGIAATTNSMSTRHRSADREAAGAAGGRGDGSEPRVEVLWCYLCYTLFFIPLGVVLPIRSRLQSSFPTPSDSFSAFLDALLVLALAIPSASAMAMVQSTGGARWMLEMALSAAAATRQALGNSIGGTNGGGSRGNESRRSMHKCRLFTIHGLFVAVMLEYLGVLFFVDLKRPTGQARILTLLVFAPVSFYSGLALGVYNTRNNSVRVRSIGMIRAGGAVDSGRLASSPSRTYLIFGVLIPSLVLFPAVIALVQLGDGYDDTALYGALSTMACAIPASTAVWMTIASISVSAQTGMTVGRSKDEKGRKIKHSSVAPLPLSLSAGKKEGGAAVGDNRTSPKLEGRYEEQKVAGPPVDASIAERRRSQTLRDCASGDGDDDNDDGDDEETNSWLMGQLHHGLDAEDGTARVLASSTAACCVMVFIPFGVWLPLVTVSEDQEWGGAGTGSFVGYAGLLFLIGVSTSSVMLHMRLQYLQAEERAKFAAVRLRLEMAKFGVTIHLTLARLLYDTFQTELGGDVEAMQQWLLCKDVIFWKKESKAATKKRQLVVKAKSSVEASITAPAARSVAHGSGDQQHEQDQQVVTPQRSKPLGALEPIVVSRFMDICLTESLKASAKDAGTGWISAKLGSTKLGSTKVESAKVGLGEKNVDGGGGVERTKSPKLPTLERAYEEQHAGRGWASVVAQVESTRGGKWVLVSPNSEIEAHYKSQLLHRVYLAYATATNKILIDHDEWGWKEKEDRLNKQVQYLFCQRTALTCSLTRSFTYRLRWMVLRRR